MSLGICVQPHSTGRRAAIAQMQGTFFFIDKQNRIKGQP
jgi:hypothetical protein